MEHSLLHALQLCGIVIALGGPILMLGIFFPALRSINYNGQSPKFAEQLSSSASRWVFFGALFGAVAAVLNLFVDVAEIKGQTIFGGVSPATVWRFATVTTVGHLALARIAALVLVAVTVRLPGKLKWWLVLAFALAAVVFTGLVSHAAAQPTGRTQAILLELAHILAASTWLGILIHLLLARTAIESATDANSAAIVAGIVKRFSPIALTVVVLLVVSGLIAAARFLSTPAAVPTSAYGLTLVVKMTLLLPLLYAGYMNYNVIQPALQTMPLGVPPSGGQDRLKPELQTVSPSDQSRRALLRRFGKMLELEVTAGVLVITVAGILASVSPPGADGGLRLTSAQARALLSPDLPTTRVANPEVFVGAPERTLDDLRYSEFTHNWSGVMVCVMGLCWLAQSLGGRLGVWAEKFWPFSFVPFALFIAVAADPEVWILGKVSLAQAFVDPALLEHQIGALLVLILAWLGWRDRRNPPEKRPLGYALPVLMILGSLLLLGHAHSNFTASQELTNLINVQHAVLGAFGLFAGTVRWLNLRGLFPDRVARVIWPSLVIGLGLFMTFFYREVV